MTGPDRARFLNGLVTCAVGELADGHGTFGFLTSLKGRVLADLVVLATAETFLIDVPAGEAGNVSDHILKYRIADRAELEPVDTAVLRVAGPAAAERLAGWVGELPVEAWDHREVEIAGSDARLVRRGNAPLEAFDLRLAPGDEAAVRQALASAGAAEAEPEEWERLRVAAGIPRFGVDFGTGNFPQETGLGESGVAYDKGCYLGQEVVARIHYRGGVNKRLCGLTLSGGAVPAAGTEVHFDGRAAGTTGSAVATENGARALAILHTRVETGAAVEVAGVGEATVVELPFP
ncbi:MAG TPA: hypothetical protein VKU40_06675 [Thermoanaerobaculia bacterium]|nr:hypothetical protein [Thermoanaerobaculia bacterium]